MSQYLGHLSADVLVVPTTAENCAHAHLDKHTYNLFENLLFSTLGHQLATIVNCATHEYHHFSALFLDVTKHYLINTTKFTLACYFRF